MTTATRALARSAGLVLAAIGWGCSPEITEAQLPIGFDSVLALPVAPPDFTIAYGSGALQFGHLRLPDTPGPHPVVLFIHGGCWLSQYTIRHVGAVEAAVADAGFAVWSLEYRRVGDDGGGWPGTFQDIGRGADHLRALAAEHALDLSRIIAAGHSAGGQLALWLAARGALAPSSALHTEDPVPIQAVFALAPAPDLEGLHAAGVCGNVIDALMGGSPAEYPERYRAVSPMQLAPLAVPQVLVIGARDTQWGPVGRTYYERAVAAGDSLVRLVEAAESGHFDMIAPTTATWSVILSSLTSLLDEVSLHATGPARP